MIIQFEKHFGDSIVSVDFVEENRKKVTSFVDAVKAFARSSYQCVYIINYFTGKFEYFSDNLKVLCGESSVTHRDFTYDVYKNHIPLREQEVLKDVNRDVLDLFAKFPLPERMNYVAQYSFHIMNGDKAQLTQHSLTPLCLTEDGTVWLALCTISMSSKKTACDVLVRKDSSPVYYQYNLRTHHWEERTHYSLTSVERDVLALSTQGYTMTEIADAMCKSVDTIKACKRRLFAKLGVNSVAAALYQAVNYKNM